jgi:kinesin family member 6/9
LNANPFSLFLTYVLKTKLSALHSSLKHNLPYSQTLQRSERTSRTGISGTLFKEASYINLSLHFLEQVIVALYEKAQGKRSHVPYRNSMMTSVLRDSLGGNCMTTMIATVAPEDDLIEVI